METPSHVLRARLRHQQLAPRRRQRTRDLPARPARPPRGRPAHPPERPLLPRRAALLLRHRRPPALRRERARGAAPPLDQEAPLVAHLPRHVHRRSAHAGLRIWWPPSSGRCAFAPTPTTRQRSSAWCSGGRRGSPTTTPTISSRRTGSRKRPSAPGSRRCGFSPSRWPRRGNSGWASARSAWCWSPTSAEARATSR